MNAAREHILGVIRGSLGRGSPGRGSAAEPAEPPPRAADANPLPARSEGDRRHRIELFVDEAERVDTTVDRVAEAASVPGAVAAYLALNDLPTVLKVAPDPRLGDIPWSREAALTITEGRAGGEDPVGVAGAFAGIAETGTLVLLSGPESPTTLNFLPDTHIVVLRAAHVVGTYEETWARLRERAGDANPMPRAVNWITGPSRTADIEQTLMLGAHGPRRLHVVLIDDQGTEDG